MNGGFDLRVYLLDAARKTDREFDYLVPDSITVVPGTVVTVPFGRQNKPANAMAVKISDSNDEDLTKFKSVISVSDTASLSPDLLELAFFVREHTVCTLGDAVHAMIPPDALSHFVDRYFVSPDADESELAFDPEAEKDRRVCKVP